MDKKWICVDIATRYNRPELYNEIVQHLKEMFDGAEVVMFGDFMDEINFSNDLVSYVFVQCDNVYKYRDEIKSCKYIGQVLRSIDDPVYVSDEEISKMIEGWDRQKKKSKTSFRYGDMVKINAGIYSSMFGIVVLNPDEERYVVVVKLVDEYHIIELSLANCESTGFNMFDNIKVVAE